MDDESKLVPNIEQPTLRRQSTVFGRQDTGQDKATGVPSGEWGELNRALPNVPGDEATVPFSGSESYISESSCGEESGDESSSPGLRRERGITASEAIDILQERVDRLCFELEKLWGDLGRASDSEESFAIFDQIELAENKVHTLLRSIQRYRKYR